MICYIWCYVCIILLFWLCYCLVHRLNSYFKFFIVRDPFERLISAFKDKFVKNPRFEPWYKHDIAPAIIRKYRRSHHDDSESVGLQFEDFVRYLGDKSGRQRLDRHFGDHIIHWLTYAELCAPCDISYNVVGHHETLENDAPYILKAAGIADLVSYPNIPPGITRYNCTKVESYFTGISQRDVRRLYASYQGDFSLFDYQKPAFLLDWCRDFLIIFLFIFYKSLNYMAASKNSVQLPGLYGVYIVLLHWSET